LTTTAATVYTVPASTKFYMRHVRIVNVLSTNVNAFISIGSAATPTWWLPGSVVYANDSWDWNGVEVIPAGTVIQAYASSSIACNIFISGIEET